MQINSPYLSNHFAGLKPDTAIRGWQAGGGMGTVKTAGSRKRYVGGENISRHPPLNAEYRHAEIAG